MQRDLRFCFQGCCRLVDGQQVDRDKYEASIPQTPLLGAAVVEVQIPCRRNPGALEAAVEAAVGFYLGQPVKRAFGQFMATGELAFLFDGRTGERRRATEADIAKWNAAWSQQVESMRKG